MRHQISQADVIEVNEIDSGSALPDPELSPRILTIGIVGLGIIGKVHLANSRDFGLGKIVALADPQLSAVADSFDGLPVYEDWRELVAAADIDAVIICLPHFLHADCAEAAMKAGKHVFLEKPLATSLADAKRLVACAEEYGRVLMVNMTHRYYPPIRKARELIRSGAIGDIISVRDHYMEVIDRREFPAWFFDPKAAGGGVAMTDSIHLLDRVSWLIDEPLELIGQSSRSLDPASAVEDSVELLCQTASGVSVTVGSFFCFNSRKTWADQLTIFGTAGTLSIHAWSHVEWTPHGGSPHRFDGYDEGLPLRERGAVGHRAALNDFIEAIEKKRPSESDAATLINVQEILQSFYDAKAKGEEGRE